MSFAPITTFSTPNPKTAAEPIYVGNRPYWKMSIQEKNTRKKITEKTEWIV